MPEVEVNGTRLFYQQSGEGPDVVLVHAVTSNQAVWVFSGLVEALAADFRVTAYDMRGHGASARPATGYTSAVMAEDFRQLHATLGLKPALLVGHSFGGVVSMHAAVVAPECVAGVLLSDSFFPGLKHVEPNFGKMSIWVDLRETFARVGVELGDTVDFTRLFRETAALTPDKMKELEDIYGAFGRGWLRQLPRLAETTCGDEVLAEAGLTESVLAGIAQPVVALYDEFSPFLATCRWLEQHLARCSAEIIPAAKHLAMLDNTAGFTDAVKRHLTRLSQ
ncbi:alpha/beta hydrolase [Gemmata sp. G18]|uniref:Alpha/beta hydrolase n=1 Tax=Gemmata palustris TaxID=2822762 RepID=A0ABS5BUZ1_9BACT|nr:alpha/beta hydrolase [Gemmata palustris]MBP3957465.1 alpha/beta hydrolase [Gemmata palustris]